MRLLMEKNIQTHIVFDTKLDIGPYMTQGIDKPQKAHLIGMITHQGQSGARHCILPPYPGCVLHYTARTRRKDIWTLFNDEIVTIETRAIL